MRRILVGFLIVALVVLVAVAPSFKHSWYWANNYYGLVTLAGLSKEELSINPYSQDFFWISPDIALWILTNLDYPYQNCPDQTFVINCKEPKLNYALSSVGIISKEGEERMFNLAQHLVKSKHPIDDLSHDGLTALHASILSREERVLDFLLKSGANPDIKIVREGQINGLDAVGFLEFLTQQNPDIDYTGIRATLSEDLQGGL